MQTENTTRANVLAEAVTSVHHELYSLALEANDLRGMAESAGILCIAFAAKGQPALARKYAEEFLSCVGRQDPE